MKRNVMMIALGCMLVTGAAQAAAPESFTSSRWIDGVVGGLAGRLVSHGYYQNSSSATEGQALACGAVVALLVGGATETKSWQNFFKYVAGTAVAYAGSLSFFPPAEKRATPNDKLARSRN